MPFFNDIPRLPEDPIFSLPIDFAADTHPHKINLGVGSYRTSDGHPLLLSSVKKAESLLLQKNLYKEYLPIDGDQEFLKYALMLLFGTHSPLLLSGNFFVAQSVGGANALRIAGEFLARCVSSIIFISRPSWLNHKQIFEKSGLRVGSYPYFDVQTGLLDFNGMREAIKNMPSNSVILLHGCCHNPTGIDPTEDQWRELSSLIKYQNVIPFFDVAYQGFGSSLDEDAKAVRYFAREGHEMLVSYSFSKNFGVYGERIGFLAIGCNKNELIPNIGSQIKSLIRGNYSNPPIHGARIISTILKSHELTLEWKTELSNMRERIKNMRKALIAALLVKGKNRNFTYLSQQQGLFCFLGLNTDQVAILRKDNGIYMPINGRINLAGLNTHNITYLAEALLNAISGNC